MVVEKNKILESWIMVEHLSEGNLNVKDTLRFDDLENYDFYTLFATKIKNKNFRKNQEGGLSFYFDIFKFEEIIDYLRSVYHLEKVDEDVRYGNKFSFALYFDKELNFDPEKTFFTVSGYIRYYKKIPHENIFTKFEEDIKEEFAQYFKMDTVEKDKFNGAISKILKKYTISIENCRFQILNNLETDDINLHSFFVEDLEKAKVINTKNLEAYLFGTNNKEKVNLDSKKDSVNFNPYCFEQILKPKNYPLGRFPSQTQYSLSLMQQVVVNLAIGYDRRQLRSVNGPPGTGKTTLLKDIFSELIVRQAYDMCNINHPYIKGSNRTRYFDNASIGELPQNILKNSILVASSNNGAVQNIVNELPLIEKIDENLQEDLKQADYFFDLSNSHVFMEWKKDEKGKNTYELVKEPISEEVKFWGLFSLEGGKSENMTKILNYMKAIVKEFDNEEYEGDTSIYDQFKSQYKEVERLRDEVQKIAEIIEKNKGFRDKFERFFMKYKKELESRQKNLILESEKLENNIRELEKERANLNIQYQDIKNKREGVLYGLSNRKMLYEEKKKNQPSFFSLRRKKKYKIELNELMKKLIELQDEDDACRRLEEKIYSDLNMIEQKIKNKKEKKKTISHQFQKWRDLKEREIKEGSRKVEYVTDLINSHKETILDMNKEYGDLQLFNPWFDESYRIAQSKLFITALRVRKQFLYENRKNLKAAIIIWNKQTEYLERKYLIEIAWSWINLTIPVISSTFASFSRMCRHIGANSIGRLFIDEAGQALPQAAVGAIYRSKDLIFLGDPSQIKPVLTLETSVLSLLSEHFKVGKKYLSESASAQTLADAASQYGFYKDREKSPESWIGIPLWVHRRCKYPMFTISNEISYNGLMVQGIEKKGKTAWYDIRGKAIDKYVEEQGEFLLEEIKRRMKNNEKDKIYVISPFKNVAYKLQKKLNKIGFTIYENNKAINIGTIHTFQGKEAPTVFLVLGADNSSKGAATWAMKEPNMMNVAATRAKEEFYIIGDKKLYGNLGSDVATSTINIINQYKKDNPELVAEIQLNSGEAGENEGNEGENLKQEEKGGYYVSS